MQHSDPFSNFQWSTFNLVSFHLAIFQARGGGQEPLFRLIPPGLILVAEMNGLALPVILKIITWIWLARNLTWSYIIKCYIMFLVLCIYVYLLCNKWNAFHLFQQRGFFAFFLLFPSQSQRALSFLRTSVIQINKIIFSNWNGGKLSFARSC